jgi:hypothetical protein
VIPPTCNTMMFKLWNTGILAGYLYEKWTDMELCQGDNIPVFLHAHLQVVYYNCVKFHKNSISSLVGVALTRYTKFHKTPISRLGGVALTRYTTPPFRESISWIISPFKFWTATIFLHAHLQVLYYNCVKFHKTPISRLGGVALTRYTTPLFVKV